VAGLAADKFRLVALNARGDWAEGAAAQDAARAAQGKPPKDRSQRSAGAADGAADGAAGWGTPPPPDADTG